MKLTSAEANKVINKLNDERDALLRMEQENRTFVAATVEDIEEARPEYSYEETRDRLAEIDEKVRKIKHTLNLFNVSQELPGFGMTIDQALICIPQLTAKKRKLAAMRSIPKKQRNMSTRSTNLLEYSYANFDVALAEADYNAAADRLARLQNALDLINSTVKIDFDL